MKRVTSMTVLTTAEGKRLSVTFFEIDEKGNIIREKGSGGSGGFKQR